MKRYRKLRVVVDINVRDRRLFIRLLQNQHGARVMHEPNAGGFQIETHTEKERRRVLSGKMGS